MGAILAFSGKGGSGKTTLAALTVRHLGRCGVGPVLAVDADPNATLGLALGVPVESTIADLRERMGEAAMQVSEIPKERLMGQWLAEILSEQRGFDLLTMGRPEGPKCYCYVNGLLRRYLKELRGAYPVVVVDCEAGMEYLSRLTVDDIDSLVLVAEATSVGLASAARIGRLADALPIRVKRRVLVVNKVGQPGLAEADLGGQDIGGAAHVVRVPFDPEVYRQCAQGQPLDDRIGDATRSAIASLAEWCLPQLCQGQNAPSPR